MATLLKSGGSVALGRCGVELREYSAPPEYTLRGGKNNNYVKRQMLANAFSVEKGGFLVPRVVAKPPTPG
jgi:hypothetical protein